MTQERRLAFGEVAELYDVARPSYPAELVDEVTRFARVTSGAPALEVGAGTGKATELFAERGLEIVALEPSAEMAWADWAAELAATPGFGPPEARSYRWRETYTNRLVPPGPADPFRSHRPRPESPAGARRCDRRGARSAWRLAAARLHHRAMDGAGGSR